MSMGDAIKVLVKTIEKLQDDLHEERRLRVFAMAALNQRITKVEEVCGIGDSEEESYEERKPPVVPSKSTAFNKPVSGVQRQPPPQQQHPQQQRQARNPTVKPIVPEPLTTSNSHNHKKAVSKAPQQRLDSSVNSAPPQRVNSAPSVLKGNTSPPPQASRVSPPGKANKVQFADERASASRYRKGSAVEVRCVANGDGGAKWDAAVVQAVQGDGHYVVKFSDGEEWAGVPGTDMRPASCGVGPPENDHSYFSGYVWLHQPGWIQTSVARQWMLLVDDKLFFTTDASNIQFDREVSMADLTIEPFVRGVTLDTAPHQKAFTIKHKDASVDYVVCESEYDYKMWTAKLAVAAYKLDNTKELRDSYAATRAMVQRPVVPCLEPDKKPEEMKHNPTLAKSYIICKSGNSWFSKGDWARRWVTVHDGWFTVRPDKQSAAQALVVPLKDTTIQRKRDDVSNPYCIEVTGPFLKPLTVAFCFDTSPIFMQWCLSFEEAYLKANPDRKSSGLDMQELSASDIIPAEEETSGGSI